MPGAEENDIMGAKFVEDLGLGIVVEFVISGEANVIKVIERINDIIES